MLVNSDDISTSLSCSSIPKLLLTWYDTQQRTLPWRKNKTFHPTPYHVWISEIMLQQTTVAIAIPYYKKFIKKWPDLNTLSTATLDEILFVWQGLGYYNRAHSLHRCVQILSKNYKGIFPKNEKELRKLPGIGPYTAAALLSIAFNKPAVAIDGNVIRIFSRLFALPQIMPHLHRVIYEKASQLLPAHRFDDYTQALMDLGSTICKPKNPNCSSCPLNKLCIAFVHQKNVLLFPVKTPKPPIKHLYGSVFWLERPDGYILFQKQTDKKLLKGLCTLPLSSFEEDIHTPSPMLTLPHYTQWVALKPRLTHKFTHFTLQLTIWKGLYPYLEHKEEKNILNMWIHPKTFEIGRAHV